jgi:hypothetical protein
MSSVVIYKPVRLDLNIASTLPLSRQHKYHGIILWPSAPNYNSICVIWKASVLTVITLLANRFLTPNSIYLGTNVYYKIALY